MCEIFKLMIPLHWFSMKKNPLSFEMKFSLVPMIFIKAPAKGVLSCKSTTLPFNVKLQS